VLKLLFLSFAFSSGASGGIFFPILFVGYIFGLGFGKLVPIVFPELGVDMGISFASVGIGALLGAATQEPISSLIIVFEITKDYNILPALMLSTVVSVLLSKKMSNFSIYNYQLVKEGISLEENEEVTLMSENHVELCYVKDCVTAHPNDKIIDIVDKMRELERFECYVIDEKRKYMGALNGILTSSREVNYNLINPIIIARDLIDISFPVVFPDTPLSDAVKKMSQKKVIELPVIDSTGDLIGCIHEHDIIEFYNREILSKSSMLKTVHRSQGREHNSIEYLDNYVLESVSSTPRMWGKTLLDLKFREKFNVLILAVKERDSKKSAISPSRKFKPGDILIAAATKDDMESFIENLEKGGE
jgi:CIC family chloride channel protein